MRNVLATTLVSLFMLSAAGTALAEDVAAYDKNCLKCHGADGKGDEKRAKLLKVDLDKLSFAKADNATATADDLKKIIVEGKGKMPAYGKKLSAEEIDQVVEHTMALIKTLHEKK